MGNGITVDAWMAELERLGVGGDAEGVSVEDLSEVLGVGSQSVRKRLKAATKAGRIECAGKRSSRTIDGRQCFVPVYRLCDVP